MHDETEMFETLEEEISLETLDSILDKLAAMLDEEQRRERN